MRPKEWSMKSFYRIENKRIENTQGWNLGVFVILSYSGQRFMTNSLENPPNPHK